MSAASFAGRDTLSALAAFYRHQLLDDVVPFWETRTQDPEHGGYLHLFDRSGKLLGTDKNVWCQGRMLWMFSALYNNVEKRPAWLSLARSGRDFLVRHAYAGDGRWRYLLSGSGSVVRPELSFFTDAFVLTGLAEYARATGSDEDRPLIEATFHQIEGNAHREDFNEFHHFSLDPRYRWHSVSMIGLFVSSVVAPLLGHARTDALASRCLDDILHVFAKDSHHVLLEAVGRDGAYADSAVGRRINPGHTMESMWFCMEEALRRGDTGSVDRCVQIIDWAWAKGHDERFGGVLNILDHAGGEPAGYDAAKSFGEAWDDKVWWVHSETLYALLLAAASSGRRDLFDRFLELHEWSQRSFHDPVHGEWYAYLHRDGSPKVTDKGTWIKAAFHVPRNLMQIMLLLEREARR
jgi:N-acylglucosamine 2-epimerase